MPKGRPLVRLGDPWQHTPHNNESEAAMTASFQTPRALQTPVSLTKKPTPQTVFVDRDGDEWLVTGHNGRGELVLSCPNPQSPGDQGEGESRAWTLHEVQSAFGPLMARTAVNAA